MCDYKDDIFFNRIFLFFEYWKNKIPYILKSFIQIGYEIIRDYVEVSRDTRALLRTNYNENIKIKDNKILNKSNKTLKDGLILYLEKCDTNRTLLFKNMKKEKMLWKFLQVKLDQNIKNINFIFLKMLIMILEKKII